MKFRCERDVLDRAFSIARRAVSGRGGSLPVLSGLHLQLVGDKLTVTGSDLDLTIRVEARASVIHNSLIIGAVIAIVVEIAFSSIKVDREVLLTPPSVS